MRKYLLIFMALSSAAFIVFAEVKKVAEATDANATAKQCVVEVTFPGAIGPASLDLFERSNELIRQKKCAARLLLINTPGGSLQTTRLIVEHMLAEPYPTLCLVYPSGAHAGSAGAIILQACHLAGAMKATNIGAATPIASSGENITDDLRKKIMNDTKSWVEGLAKLRGRNIEFAHEIIEEAKAVSSDEALKLKAIELVPANKEEFLLFAQEREYKIDDKPAFKVALGETIIMPIDFRYQVMDLLMSPQVAYMIFMGSLGLLYFELTHPGSVAPGVIGGIGLLVSLISLHMLEVKWGAVLLIIAGIGFMIAEAFVTGFGILGVGGVVAFFIGSLFLFDPVTSGHSLPLSLIAPTTLLVGGLMIFVAYLALSARRRKLRTNSQTSFTGEVGVVTQVQDGDAKFGYIEIGGEIWHATSDNALVKGQKVIVLKSEGLTLHVKSYKEQIK